MVAESDKEKDDVVDFLVNAGEYLAADAERRLLLDLAADVIGALVQSGVEAMGAEEAKTKMAPEITWIARYLRSKEEES